MLTGSAGCSWNSRPSDAPTGFGADFFKYLVFQDATWDYHKRPINYDADFALAWVVKHARTRQEQDQAHAALRAKCDILWAQLDALYFAYVEPGWPPPGAFRIDSKNEAKRV